MNKPYRSWLGDVVGAGLGDAAGAGLGDVVGAGLGDAAGAGLGDAAGAGFSDVASVGRPASGPPEISRLSAAVSRWPAIRSPSASSRASRTAAKSVPGA